MSQQKIVARILAAKSYERSDMLDQIEKEHGRGFRKAVQEAIEAHESVVATDKALRRPTARRRR